MTSRVPIKSIYFLIFLTLGLSLYNALFTHMNNWLIFRSSFYHIIDGLNLYALYPQEHHDLYKYSPIFALIIAPLAILPPWLGAVLWNLLGTLLFVLALKKLNLPMSAKKGIFWISLPEFIGSTQGFQSNIHLVSLLILCFTYLEDNKKWQSMFALNLSLFIKIFGGLGALLPLFYLYQPINGNPENKKIKLTEAPLLQGATLFIIFSFLPILVIGWDSLILQYKNWLVLLRSDAAQSYGFSLMGVIHSFTHSDFDRLPIQLAGGISLVLSFLYFRKGDQQQRLMSLVSLCYFLIVFNHKSESPTFIIAMIGFGIHQHFIRNQKLRWGLIIFTLGCVSLMYSDLFRSIKQSHLDRYCVKVWPFLILYPLALFQGFLTKRS